MLLLLLLLGLCYADTENCCQMTTSDGLINLKEFDTLNIVLEAQLEFIADHTVFLQLCRNLDEQNLCHGHTETTGPTPMKDEYKYTEQESCWYVGDFEKCTWGDWDKDLGHSKMIMTGKAEADAQRDLELFIHCDENENPGYLECTEVTPKEGNIYTYVCDLYSNFGCPFEIQHKCFDKEPTDPEVCSGHGKCIDLDKCECNAGYKGDICEVVDKAVNGPAIAIGILVTLLILAIICTCVVGAAVLIYVLWKKGFKFEMIPELLKGKSVNAAQGYENVDE